MADEKSIGQGHGTELHFRVGRLSTESKKDLRAALKAALSDELGKGLLTPSGVALDHSSAHSSGHSSAPD
jgi:hypothetical protein